MATIDKIKKLTKQLLPTGRAFKMPIDGVFEKLRNGLAVSEEKAFDDAKSILNSALPDNDDFSESDATSWERRLGLITNTSVSLEDRKAAIRRKMNHPGLVKARQNFNYVQGQLRAAGFDVYVYENRFPDGGGGYETKDPLVVTGGIGGVENQLGDNQLGDAQLGPSFGNYYVANSITQEGDLDFEIGSNLIFTFFIGGNPIGTFANVDSDREIEFRQLILKLKPAHTVAFLFINYV